MNDRNAGGMSISALLWWGLAASIAIPIVCLIVLGYVGAANTQLLLPVGLVLGLVIVIGGCLATFAVRRKMQERLLSLVDICRNVVGGDRSVRAVVNGDDELAMLATSLNNLLDSQNSTTGTGVSTLAAPTSAGDAAALQAQIEKLLQEVSAVGDGDLRVQAEVTPDTLGVLADSFNYMIEELAKVVGRVQNTAVQVTNASRRVLDRSAELAQSSEIQVARISQTSQAVEALATFVQEVARNAQLSAESAQEALQNAKTGQDSVRQSIEGMSLIRENVQETSKKIKRLGERSNEIGEIVRIIEDIADQTNLLALNAAIQSAMAGEHGRGFAVVADEIRILAERSTESTKRIATLVKSIQGDTYEAVVAMEESTQGVVKGSQLADEAGRALNSIYMAVERQARAIEMIAQAANDQASVSENVANAMNEISEITSRTNAGTQEAAMSVSYLSELSDQLRASVSTFRLPERTDRAGELFPQVESIAALPPGTPEINGQFFQPDGSANGVWEQNFSADFLSLPQPQESDSTNGGFQFAFTNQGDLAGQSGFANTPFPARPLSLPGAPQGLPNGSQGFDNQSFGDFASTFPSQPQFGEMIPFNGQSPLGQAGFDGRQGLGQTGLSNRSAFGQPGFGQTGFDGQANAGRAGFPSQPGFPGQSFAGLPEAGFGQQNLPRPPLVDPAPTRPRPGIPPAQRGQVSNPPRWRNPQQEPGLAPFNPEQTPTPFPGQGNGHNGQ